VRLTPYPILVPFSWKGRAIFLLPYGPYGLYRASVPVEGCTFTQIHIYLCTRPQSVKIWQAPFALQIQSSTFGHCPSCNM